MSGNATVSTLDFVLARDLTRGVASAARRRSLQIIHGLSVLSFVTCVALCGTAYALGNAPLSRFFAGYLLAYVASMLLLRRGHSALAGWIVFLSIDSGIVLLTCLVGPESTLQVLFLVLIAFPYFVMGDSDPATRWALTLVPIGSFLLVEATGYGLVPRAELPAASTELMRVPLVLAAFGANILVLALYSRRAEEKEAAERLSAAERRAEAERQAMEANLRETQKLESLGVLAGGIAHDFNNLLTGILANASAAAESAELSPALALRVDQIERSSRAAAELCRQMLAYSGRGHFVIGPLDLSALVTDTIRLLELSVSKTVELDLELAPDLPPVDGDRAQLRQVAMNLVMNASEALRDTPGRVAVRTRVVAADEATFARCFTQPTLPAGDYVVLEVEDDAGALAPGTVGKVFEPFFSTKDAGRGLGLSAVLGIVRGHRGAIEVDGRPGERTTFRVFLPASVDRLAAPARDARDPLSAVTLRGQGVALVADDIEGVRIAVVAELEEAGFEVVTAADGLAAVALIDAHALRVAVLDLTMPGLGGEGVLRHLREHQPDVPALIVSGYDATEAMRPFGSVAGVGFLQKPFTVAQLRGALAPLLADGA